MTYQQTRLAKNTRLIISESETDMTIVKRRGRPASNPNPNAAKPAPVETAQSVAPAEMTVAAAVAPSARRRRASVGGFEQKLRAPQRQGFVRRWVNDTGNRVADMEELAYAFVHEQGIKTDGPDTRVRRLTGTKPNGDPQFSYLMETPEHEYAFGVQDRESQLALTDEAINSGRDINGALVGDVVYGGKGSSEMGN